MIKKVKVCDKCGKEQIELYPFYKIRIEASSTKIDKVEESLCRDCLRNFVNIQKSWMLNKEEIEEHEGYWFWDCQLRDIEGEIYSIYKCSCCGYKVDKLTTYCPNCGERKGEHK